MTDSGTLQLFLSHPTQTQQVGNLLGQNLDPIVLLLTGDLGAGKTSLVQAIGEGLGITDVITSPTFTLLQEYPEGRLPLYHFDLYRLSASEVQDLHPEHYWLGIEVPLGITAIEWPERLPLQPEHCLKMELIATEGGRKLNLTPQGLIPNWSHIQNLLIPFLICP